RDQLLKGGQRPWVAVPHSLTDRSQGTILADGNRVAQRVYFPVLSAHETVEDCRRANRGAAENARDPKPRPTSLWHGCLPAKTGTVSCDLAPAPSSWNLVLDPGVLGGIGASTPSARDLSSKPESGKATLKRSSSFFGAEPTRWAGCRFIADLSPL